MSHCCCGSLVVFVFSVFCLPSSFLPHLLLPCVCLWAWQQSGTPEEDQLITHRLYLPGLSTTSALECCYFVFSILWVFCLSCVLAFAFMPFPLFVHVEISSAVLLCFPPISPALLSSSPLALVSSVCLPACNPGHLVHITLQHRLLNKSFSHYFLSPLSAFGSEKYNHINK